MMLNHFGDLKNRQATRLALSKLNQKLITRSWASCCSAIQRLIDIGKQRRIINFGSAPPFEGRKNGRKERFPFEIWIGGCRFSLFFGAACGDASLYINLAASRRPCAQYSKPYRHI
jgi:hypothetical protein